MSGTGTTRAYRPIAAAVSLAAATLFTGLAAPAQAQISGDVVVQGGGAGWLYDLGAVISIFVDAPLEQPEPVAIGWAPPPMLVEDIPPPPTADAVWTGGYWTWQGDWVWSAGRWLVPPRPQYVWVQPYYEHREERVIFVPGYWSRPDVEFIAPAYDRPVSWAYVSANVVIGPPPSGPAGIFVPPPPGSRPGLIIPAPVGTPPAVVISAPPVMQVGMRIRGNVNVNSHNTVVNDNRVTNYNVTNVRNVTNVIIEAPANVTANGRAFQSTVPHQAHLAAAQKPITQVRAPTPASHAAVQAYVAGHTAAALPPPQKVQGMPAVPTHPVAALSQAQRSQMAHPPIVPPQHASSAIAETGQKNANPSTAPAQDQSNAHRTGQPMPLSANQIKDAPPAHEGVAEQAKQHTEQVQVQQHQQLEANVRKPEQQQADQAQRRALEQQRQEELRAQVQIQEKQREQQEQQRQHAQAEEQTRQREQQQVQREHAHMAEQAQQQGVQAEAQARQHEQQRIQAEQRVQKAQQEAATQAARQRSEHARPRADEASRPANGRN